MRFTTPIVLATLAVLASVQALPANTGEAHTAENKHGVEGTEKAQGYQKPSEKDVDIPDIDVKIPPEGVKDRLEDADLDDLINHCLDDPELDECLDIDFDITECLEENSREECFEELRELLEEP
ncbi:hypothetical protein BDB00DRAFT_804963 [Zychaea mexicana]|uniref:uncharacterized protein n=1 Tax=Zychaea mexicana TaxID=64656 RepID=UPI0022FE3C27|nr:uncharacterized protein BDB00DRAFT_804963 [Zychaea mexicana]KAI9497528.1 hypothetical protein BDB00DRAFT_804963 [Zychaea mexicana]